MAPFWTLLKNNVKNERKAQIIKSNLLLNGRKTKERMQNQQEEANKLEKHRHQLQLKVQELRNSIKKVQLEIHDAKKDIYSNESQHQSRNHRINNEEIKVSLLKAFSVRTEQQIAIYEEYVKRIRSTTETIQHRREEDRKRIDNSLFNAQQNKNNLSTTHFNTPMKTIQSIHQNFHQDLANYFKKQYFESSDDHDQQQSPNTLSLSTPTKRSSTLQQFGLFSFPKEMEDRMRSQLQEIQATPGEIFDTSIYILKEILQQIREQQISANNQGNVGSIEAQHADTIARLISDLQKKHIDKVLETQKILNDSTEIRVNHFQSLLQQRNTLLSRNEHSEDIISLRNWQLEDVAGKQIVQYLEEKIEEIHANNQKQEKIKENLAEQFQSIQRLQKQRDLKMALIKWIIQQNMNQRKEILQRALNIHSFTKSKIIPMNDKLGKHSQQLHNWIQEEIEWLDMISLDNLLISSSSQNDNNTSLVAVKDLLINQMHSSASSTTFPSSSSGMKTSDVSKLLELINFPEQESADRFIPHLVEQIRQEDILELQLEMEKKQRQEIKQKMKSMDDQHLKAIRDKFDQLNTSHQHDWLPMLQQTEEQLQEALEESKRVQQLEEEWSNQPARFVVPWKLVNGMNFQEILEKVNSTFTEIHRTQEALLSKK